MRRGMLLVAALLVGARAFAAPIQITIDVSPSLSGDAKLAFDLFDGGDALSNSSVTITGLAVDGVAVPTFPASVMLTDAAVFDEFIQPVTLGTVITFVFDAIGNFGPPPLNGPGPDNFFLQILDASMNILVFTDAPLDTNALLVYGSGEADPLAIYASDQVLTSFGPALAAPEPDSSALFATALALFVIVGRRTVSRPSRR